MDLEPENLKGSSSISNCMAKVSLRVQTPLPSVSLIAATRCLIVRVQYHLGLEFLRTGLGLLRTAEIGGSA
jgi:hypothetical protein